MTITDIRGNILSGTTAEGAAVYDAAVQQFALLSGDPLGAADALTARDPSFVMAHALKAWLMLLGTEPAGLAPAREIVTALGGMAMTTQERGHVTALGHLAEGRWWDASRVMEELSAAHPRDLLALQAGHQIDYFTGNARLLRDRIARAMPAWSPALPGHHAVLGMHAFGLEEMAEYGRAEAAGRLAVELEPRDGWARHAVAHVLEMQGRHREGITFMGSDAETWAPGSFLAVHNWWHLALYHLEMGDIAAVHDLLDGPIRAGDPPTILNLIDLSAMLWRLMLRGVDVSARWDAVADGFEAVWQPGLYAFNDLHATMAFLGAGRRDRARAIQEAQEAAAHGTGDNARFAKQVGIPLIRGFIAFAEGSHRDAMALIRPVLPIAAMFGGSHAQRDVIGLTLMEAALRGGERDLARTLAAARLAAKPESPLAGMLARRAGLAEAA